MKVTAAKGGGVTIALGDADAHTLNAVLLAHNWYVPHHRLTPAGVNLAATLAEKLNARSEDVASPSRAS